MENEEFEKLKEERGKPSYHRYHNIECKIDKNGIVYFHCETCDVHIFIGQLEGFE